MNLGTGGLDAVPYSLSVKFDLAVISLDQRDSGFADELEASGHSAVTLDDLAHGPSGDGAEVFSVGYPDATAIVLPPRKQHPAVAFWASRNVSLPVSSFGRVAMSHRALPFFWADLSVYPGNSGGPVIEDSKLIGIVTHQPEVEGTLISFARATKADRVRPLIEEQQEKDALFAG